MENKPRFIQHYVKNTTKVYSKNTTIEGEVLKFTAIAFKNIGTVDAFVNGIPLAAGDSMLSFRQELPHLDHSTYDIVFSTTLPATPIQNVAVVITKIVRSVSSEVQEICIPKVEKFTPLKAPKA